MDVARAATTAATAVKGRASEARERVPVLLLLTRELIVPPLVPVLVPALVLVLVLELVPLRQRLKEPVAGLGLGLVVALSSGLGNSSRLARWRMS